MLSTRPFPVLLALAALVVIAPARSQVIRVRADPWMPFNGGEPAMPGFVTEILQAIFEPSGTKIEYASLAWEKALNACRAGEIDAVPCANRKEGAGLTFPQETISEIKYCIFTLKASTWTLTGEQSLKGHRIGAAEGYSYWDMLDRFLATNPKDVVRLGGDDTCWDGVQKLRSQEIELMPECPQVFYWTLKSRNVDAALFRTACRMAGDPVYVVFRPDEQGVKWARQFDEGIRKLRASGKLAKILGNYGVEDWK